MHIPSLLLLISPTLVFAELPQGLPENFFKADSKALAAACADKAWVVNHQSSRYLAEYGRAYLAAGERPRAEDAFRRAAAAAPKDAETYRLMGAAWLHFGFKVEALAAFDTMQKADPTAAPVFAKAACELLEAGLAEEAGKLMDRAWKLDPKAWRAAVDFGRTALRAQKPDLATAWFQKALAVKPRDERLWTDLALAYGDAARPENKP